MGVWERMGVGIACVARVHSRDDEGLMRVSRKNRVCALISNGNRTEWSPIRSVINNYWMRFL